MQLVSQQNCETSCRKNCLLNFCFRSQLFCSNYFTVGYSFYFLIHDTNSWFHTGVRNKKILRKALWPEGPINLWNKFLLPNNKQTNLFIYILIISALGDNYMAIFSPGWNILIKFILIKEKNKTQRVELCGILLKPIHFDQYRKEILLQKLWKSSFIILLFFFLWNVRCQKPSVKISVNQKAMNRISESLQWRRNPGSSSQVLCCYLFIVILMSAHWAVPVPSPQSLFTIDILYLLVMKGKIPRMTIRFPYANQFVERYEKVYSVCFVPQWLQIKPSDHPFVLLRIFQ